MSFKTRASRMEGKMTYGGISKCPLCGRTDGSHVLGCLWPTTTILPLPRTQTPEGMIEAKDAEITRLNALLAEAREEIICDDWAPNYIVMTLGNMLDHEEWGDEFAEYRKHTSDGPNSAATKFLCTKIAEYMERNCDGG